jgi:hypothetical protein
MRPLVIYLFNQSEAAGGAFQSIPALPQNSRSSRFGEGSW